METMLANVLMRLLALPVLVAAGVFAGGCGHLPTLVSNTQSDVLVVESVPVAVQPEHSSERANPPLISPQLLSQQQVDVVAGPAQSPGFDALAGTRISMAQRRQQQARLPDTLVGPVKLEDTEGVMDLPPTYWAVQIAAVKNIERMALLVQEHQLEGMLGVPMNTQAGKLHAVLTGVYVKREDALASVENLPQVFARYQPWVRPLANLQAAMR